MVGYNQNMPDVWGSFANGMEVGGALRRRQQQDQYGEAYQQGGWEAVGDAAGGQGDLQTAEGAQAVASQQEENMREAALANATILQRAHRSLAGLDEATRAERFAQLRPQLSQYVDENALNQVDTSDAGWATLGQSIEAAIGQFQEYDQVINAGNGRVIGMRRDGTQVVISEGEPQWQTNGTRPYRIVNGAVELGQGEIPRPQAGGSDGLLPGALAPYQFNPDGTLRPIQGGPADLRQTAEGRAQAQRLQSSESQLSNGVAVLNDVLGLRPGDTNPDSTPAAGVGDVSSDSAGVWANRFREWGFNQSGTDLNEALEPVRAILAFENLAEMRRNSTTGGALGSIAVRELDLLGSTVRSLSTAQRPEQLRENLLAVRRQFLRTQRAIAAARAEMDGGGEQAAAPVNDGTDAPQPRTRRWNSATGSFE